MGKILACIVAFCVLVGLVWLSLPPERRPAFTDAQIQDHIDKCIEAAKIDFPEYKDRPMKWQERFIDWDTGLPYEGDVGFERCHLIAGTVHEGFDGDRAFIPQTVSYSGDEGETLPSFWLKQP